MRGTGLHPRQPTALVEPVGVEAVAGQHGYEHDGQGDYQREFPHLAPPPANGPAPLRPISCIAPNRIGSTKGNASLGTMARKR